MAYWAVSERNFDAGTNSALISSRRRVRIRSGDSTLFFRRTGYSDVSFTACAVVQSVTPMEQDADTRTYSIAIDQHDRLEPERELADLVYSITKVWNYEHPERHFRRTYVSLPPHDYRTIVQGGIFWARTAFAMFANQLPREAFTRFLESLARSSPRALLREGTYKMAWDALRAFIEQEYVGATPLFRAICDQVVGLNRSGVDMPLEELAISADGENVADQIASQTALLADFSESLVSATDQRDLMVALAEKMEVETSSEDEFEELFGGTPWPMHRTRL